MRAQERKQQQSKKWYDSARWRATRIGYLQEHPFCADPYKRHELLPVVATDLDHIIPHKEVWELFWDRDNWQGLCHGCHSTKTATEDGGFGHNYSKSNDLARMG